MLQIGSPNISSATTRLLLLTLVEMDAAGYFHDAPFYERLIRIRDNVIAIPRGESDDVIGISFARSFSFSIATLVVKLLYWPPAIQSTVDLLEELLRLSLQNQHAPQDAIPTSALGYFVVLLPVCCRMGRLSDLLLLAGLTELTSFDNVTVELLKRIAAHSVAPDAETALLETALLVAIGSASESAAELAAILVLLAALAERYPDVVAQL
jgi:hypothetical protein